MAGILNLRREEQIGLGLAIAAHVAIAVGLAVAANREPAQLPVPERMTVSLADEVSLESTAPDPSAEPQAAIAPTLAPEPAPVIEPEPIERPIERAVTPPPEPRPTVAPRATSTPTPRPRATQQPPREQPRPQPTAVPRTERGGGSRLGSDFLEGSSAGERSESTGTPAQRAGPAEQASISQAIVRQLKPHWNAPQGVDAERLVTVLAWELNRDGTLKGRPRVVSQSGINDSNRPQAPLHAERAIRAVQLAAPFDLPEQYYDAWKSVRGARFDRNL